MLWSWLFPSRHKRPDPVPDPGEASIPPLSLGPVDGTPAAPVATAATTSTPTDAGAAAAIGAAFLIGAELALHGQASNHAPTGPGTHPSTPGAAHPGDTASVTHPGTHPGTHGDPGPGDPGAGDGGGPGS